MIGRVYRGGNVGGLLRYLYGPGRHDESLHSDPHMVAAWSHHSRADLDHLEPPVLSGEGVHAVRDFAALKSRLELAVALRAGARSERMVWHCALRNDASDRVLTDAEWAQVARDVMARTGIAAPEDPGACRWIAVRHDAESIHLVAVLAREDGRPATPVRDYHRVRQACLTAEKRLGLRSTAPADRTTATATTKGEHARAARLAGAGVVHVPDRVWLREQVQAARSEAHSAEEFLDRLRAGGVVVRERREPASGALNGYAVGRRQSGQSAEEVILYGGGKLAPDLSLPQLAKRWAIPGQRKVSAAQAPRVVLDPAQRAQIWERASAAAGAAADEVRTQLSRTSSGSSGSSPGGSSGSDARAAGDAAAAAAEVLGAAARLLEGEPVAGAEGPLTLAARDYDRAAREQYRQAVAPSAVGVALRSAAYAMARVRTTSGGRAGAARGDAVRVALMLAEFARLADAVARHREAQGRLAQAQAAQKASRQLAGASSGWEQVAVGVAEQVAQREQDEQAAAERVRAEQERARRAREQQRTSSPGEASPGASPAAGLGGQGPGPTSGPRR